MTGMRCLWQPRFTEIAMLGNAQERLHAVERAPDCEVLLHTLPTLPRIVARRKRSYVCG